MTHSIVKQIINSIDINTEHGDENQALVLMALRDDIDSILREMELDQVVMDYQASAHDHAPEESIYFNLLRQAMVENTSLSARKHLRETFLPPSSENWQACGWDSRKFKYKTHALRDWIKATHIPWWKSLFVKKTVVDDYSSSVEGSQNV